MLKGKPMYIEKTLVIICLLVAVAVLTAAFFILLYVNHRVKISLGRELNKNEIFVSSLLKKIPGGIAVFAFDKNDRSIQITYASYGFAKLSGRKVKEVMNFKNQDAIDKVVYPGDIPKVRMIADRLAESLTQTVFTFRIRHVDGSLIRVQMSVEKIREEDNKLICYAVFTKISEEEMLYRNITSDSSTGVYVCNTETYDMLYINKSAIEIMGCETDYTDRKCYNYFFGRNEPCEDCMMDRMCEDRYVTSDADIAKTGKHVIMRGRIINWNGHLARIEYLNDYTYIYQQQRIREKQYQSQMRFMEKINDGYSGNFKLNISRNECRRGFGNDEFVIGRVQNCSTYDDLVASVSTTICSDEEKQRYIGTFERENLLKLFSDGQTTVKLEHRVFCDDNRIHWFVTTVTMNLNAETGDVEGYIYAVDVTESKVNRILTEKSLVLASERLVCINTPTNSHMAFMASEGGNAVYRTDSEAAINAYLDRHCIPESLDSVKNSFRMTNVIAELDRQEPYTVFYEGKNGEQTVYNCATFSYIDKSYGMISLIITDVTGIHNQQEDNKRRLTEALKEARAADAAKSEFLSRMSHDIRTPLNAIINLSSEEMTEDADKNRLEEYLNQIHMSGDYLLGIVNEVLDMSKISSNKMKLNIAPYSVSDFEDLIVTVIGERCRKNNIVFNMNIETDKNVWINVDKVHFNQIFINLLSNAVKFTPPGGRIELSQCVISDNEIKHRSRFEVSDTGIGMSPDFLPKVFEDFSQESSRYQDIKSPGTGLGLPIVKRLVEIMGGNIRIESEKGKGTKVTVELDIEITSETDFAAAFQSNEEILKNKTILIAEDHPVNAAIIEKLLHKKGCKVELAADGKACLEAYEKSEPGHFDVILMDVRMPVMDGLEATKMIRNSGRSDASDIPIVATTANAYQEDMDAALQAGMNAHLGKPIKPETLYETLADILTERKKVMRKERS